MWYVVHIGEQPGLSWVASVTFDTKEDAEKAVPKMAKSRGITATWYVTQADNEEEAIDNINLAGRPEAKGLTFLALVYKKAQTKFGVTNAGVRIGDWH